VRSVPGTNADPIAMPVSAAISVELTGTRYLHGWVRNKFASVPSPSCRLAARARQYSSFVLLIGNLGNPNTFHPKEAIIVQNRDEILIPLLVNDLPTPKEFNEAVASLSEEQRRFATTFRSMQLESSVMGVCVVQIKPQLEVLLGLPEDALSKEVRLTQDLMSLFMEYKMPSDLLSFNGAEDASLQEKVDSVKTHVKAVLDVIEDEKIKELEEQVKKANSDASLTKAAGKAGGKSSKNIGEIEIRKIGDDEVDGDVAIPSETLQSAHSAEITLKPDSAPAVPPQVPPQVPPVQPAPSTVKQAPQVTQSESIDEEIEEAFHEGFDEGFDDDTDESVADFTALPKKLNNLFELHDEDDTLRTAIIKTGGDWKRKRQEGLLRTLEEKDLSSSTLKSEKEKAFDLLDALSRSGSLPLASGELHVVLPVTHCFEESVMGTIVQRDRNPIDKLEKSTLLVASTVHDAEVATLVEGGRHAARLQNQYKTLALPSESE